MLMIIVTLSMQSFCNCLMAFQVCTFHDGCKQGIDQEIFNRQWISRKFMHPQS